MRFTYGRWMQVFVANGTRQNKIFNYRAVEGQQVRTMPIPPGSQVQLREDFSPGQQLDSIVRQLEAFGAVPKDDVENVGVLGLVYSIQRHMPSDTIDAAIEQDVEARQEMAGDMIEKAGAATFATMAAPAPELLRASTLEVVQLDNHGDEATKGVNYEANVSTKAGRKTVTPKSRGKH